MKYKPAKVLSLQGLPLIGILIHCGRVFWPYCERLSNIQHQFSPTDLARDARADPFVVAAIKPPTHLYHLFVRTDQQRTGIGTKLLKIVDAWCVDSFGTPIVTVNSSLNAVEAYRRFGFNTDGPIIEIDGVRHQPMVRRIPR